jgi:hypothetical protein
MPSKKIKRTNSVGKDSSYEISTNNDLLSEKPKKNKEPKQEPALINFKYKLDKLKQ